MTQLVLTSLLTALSDPQRPEPMLPDPNVLGTLSESVQGLSEARVVVLVTDPQVTGPGFTSVQVDQTVSPYIQRWLAQYRYLRDHPEVEYVWCVDGTDVQMMKNPFPEMQPGTLYVGSEDGKTGGKWMRSHFKGRIMQRFFAKYGNHQLLNAGILGGSREDVMHFCHRMISMWEDSRIDAIAKRDGTPAFVRRQVTRDRDLMDPVLDMGIFNVVARLDFKKKLSFGSHVNTRFKGFDYANTTDSWWRHK
jgi:hypothetical protein